MANEDTTPPPQSAPTQGRRSSFAGQTFADLFGSGRNSVSRPSQDNGSNSPPSGQAMGPITTAAAQAQKRRLSLSTLGMGTSPGQTSPYGSYRGRRDSLSSANSGSIDESAIEDDFNTREQGVGGTQAGSSFARRMSFGAQALRDVRNSKSGSISTGAGGGGGGGGGEGFNWSENLRSRAERTSIGGPPQSGMPFGNQSHTRAKSIATMEQPTPEMPKAQKRPDHFQERILKGDFYMD
ncbi:hypothetical protein K431DRAFT_226897 [Polychaeton citri CBS 116435]|uniref:Uncharacterized protein n=1 Tax=Polychaeton citri CBS 116435 TaxID=1314669 RepID=A0A9P4Q8F7_9PEZI|nr:hypothetical protein K431DRAFT_226897 [Polychaeton citri CBS 116435]